ncbi:unnamed protein product [Clonostachys byssicola]|uniref:Uncharacterized protein n=1 Tax=Clonostachys byssicola TaxID=160290 RepID=A0A9N9U4W8_9HYPO|nr:unnamed protein product [Clonostachys byssicola]
MWFELSDGGYTYLRIAGKCGSFYDILTSLFHRMLWIGSKDDIEMSLDNFVSCDDDDTGVKKPALATRKPLLERSEDDAKWFAAAIMTFGSNVAI